MGIPLFQVEPVLSGIKTMAGAVNELPTMRFCVGREVPGCPGFLPTTGPCQGVGRPGLLGPAGLLSAVNRRKRKAGFPGNPWQPVEVRDTAVWRFEDGKVTEIHTMQDQFAFLQQVGFLPAGVYAA